MHAIHHLLPAFFVAVLTCVPPCPAAQQEEMEIPAAPADVQLTETKVEALSKELKQLEALTKVLKDLGSPAQKQPGEDAKAHLERVDVTMKARGMAIHLIHQQLERALDAKYQLAAQIDDYEQWIRKLEAGLPEFKEKYRKRAGDLETQVLELQRDGMVLASLLHDAALAAGDQAAAERYKVEFMVEGGVNLLDSVPDAAARRAKFSGKDRGNLEAEYRGIEDQVVDLDFERRLLATHAILETEALADLLPQEHREMLKAAQDALAASKDLEDRSAQISTIARYVFDNLQLVNRYPDALRRSFVLQTKVVPELPKIEAAVDSLIGGQLPLGGRRGIMRPTAVSPNDIYRAPPK